MKLASNVVEPADLWTASAPVSVMRHQNKWWDHLIHEARIPDSAFRTLSRTDYKIMSLTFDDLQLACKERISVYKDGHGRRGGTQGWCLGQWGNAIAGEVGEACNIIKKIERGDYTLDAGREELGKEFADAITYIALAANKIEVNLGRAVANKFNEVSIRVDCDTRITAYYDRSWIDWFCDVISVMIGADRAKSTTTC